MVGPSRPRPGQPRLLVENVTGGGTITFTAWIGSENAPQVSDSASITLTGIYADLDIDGNNDGAIDSSSEQATPEDLLEAKPGEPGPKGGHRD